MSAKLTGSGLRKHVADDESGVSAVEFALVMPLLLLLYLGGVELSHAITVDRKVTSAANSVGDLVAQGNIIDNQEMGNIFTAARAILEPYSPSTLKIVVSSVKIDSNGDKVLTSCAYHDAPRPKDSSITIPSGVRIEGSYLVVTEVKYEYITTLGQIFTDSINMSDTFYMRPRSVDFVTLPC